MVAGLDKLLERIAADPANAMLQERYLALVVDVDDRQRAEALVKLARVLVDSDPHEAMRLAHLVFDWDRSFFPALEVMALAFTALGRFGKAEVIQNEIRKLQDLQAQASADVSLDEPLSAPLRLQRSAITPPPPPDPNKSWFEDLSESQEDAMVNATWGEPVPIHELKWSGIAPAGPMEVPPSPKQATPREETVVGAMRRSSEPPLDLKKTTVIPSRDSNSQHQALLGELFDYYIERNLLQQAHDLLMQVDEVSRQEPWWLQRFSTWRVRQAKENLAVATDLPASAPQAAASGPHVAFWQEVDRLIEQGQLRFAYLQMQRRLAMHPDADLAEGIWQRLETLFDRMSVQGFQWQVSEGLEALVAKLREPLFPR